MFHKKIILIILLIIVVSCNPKPDENIMIGKFNIKSDLFLAQFDCKTDVDDIHSVAGVSTMLADSRFSGVHFHAVAGTYGIQEGLYVPADTLFKTVFGNKWSDAHADYNKALKEVTLLTSKTLKDGGNIWIAEAGQSDFTADLIKNIKDSLPDIETTKRIHVVQHSDWNENNTTPEKLAYVKANADYQKIPDGNATDNGSPGFCGEEKINIQAHLKEPEVLKIWQLAMEIANRFNGQEGRYSNPAIAKGGMDFSDVSETCWIFGFNHLRNAEQFFTEFTSPSH
ncbi:MAG: hypothetical protein JW956_15075 [Calditrichaceae bacterium]|nr:hypothetical protein [Calditrichaceae bacterium]